MPQKPRQISEQRQKYWDKLDALLSTRFLASHMSDTKWVKLLRASSAHSSTIPRMHFKLVYGPEVHATNTPLFPESVETDWFREPYLYKEVEWIEFPRTYAVNRGKGLQPRLESQDITALRTHLESIAKFPLVESDTGLRVVAYSEA